MANVVYVVLEGDCVHGVFGGLFAAMHYLEEYIGGKDYTFNIEGDTMFFNKENYQYRIWKGTVQGGDE